MIKSPRRAALRILGLQHASVQNPWNGFGEKPVSFLTMYE